jgi:hypothetical protein
MDRDSSVGIATHYGLDGPGIESRWRARFAAPVQTGPGATQPSIQWEPGPSPGVKRSERGVDHPPSSSAEVTETVELYLYSLSGPSWRILPLPLPYRQNWGSLNATRWFPFILLLLCHRFIIMIIIIITIMSLSFVASVYALCALLQVA